MGSCFFGAVFLLAHIWSASNRNRKRELRKDLEELGEDSEMEEDFTEDEEKRLSSLWENIL